MLHCQCLTEAVAEKMCARLRAAAATTHEPARTGLRGSCAGALAAQAGSEPRAVPLPREPPVAVARRPSRAFRSLQVSLAASGTAVVAPAYYQTQ